MIKFLNKPNSDEELFNILNPIIRGWFKKKFKTFCLPQKYGIMPIHSRENILVSAPTGSGKTLTGFLSILNELIDSGKKGILEDKVYCVYISPLKALNYDVEVNLKEPLKEMEEIAGKKLGIRIRVRTGDTSTSQRAAMTKKPPHILITTPESLAILLSTKKFKEHLRNVSWCIIDEIHALAENKRGVHLSLSLERLQRLSTYMTRIGLSATVAPLEEIAKFLVGDLRPCKVVDVQFIKKMDLKILSPVKDFINITHEELHHKMYELIDDLIQNHRTTLIFTNTRSATERVVNHLKEKFPENYTENAETKKIKDFRGFENKVFKQSKISSTSSIARGIGAHHGSLSKRLRRRIENSLREGKLKVVVTSTSLELGIDIGYIDLVILLGSPKSVARAIQRTGRSGHRLHDITKGRIIVLDRDDLVECSCLLKEAVEKKIDRIHIPVNALDVLAQHIYGIAIADKININELYKLVTRSYCYKNLKRRDFNEIILYLSGEYALEDKHVYAKIWYDKKTGIIGRRGMMARVLYMTNIGTIPEESFIIVKVGNDTIGHLDEGFLERLRRGDVFVLGGEMYEFLYAKGMVAYVKSSVHRPPTIPSWFSEMLPLSFDLSLAIERFRRLIEDKFKNKVNKEELIKFILDYLYVDKNGANAIYEYFKEQYLYAEIPHDKKIIIENYKDKERHYSVFHTLFGRRVNDCLSRAVAFSLFRSQHRDVEIGITDNGFYLASEKQFNAKKAFSLLKAEEIDRIMKEAIEKTEVLKRRFRHCATRALMILRNYKGKKKKVGRQQVSSMILYNALRRIDPNFSIIKEAKREVLEDLMDIDNTKLVLQSVEKGKISVKEINTIMPSPFAFMIGLQGYIDVLKMEERMEFLKRMHQMVLAKIGKENK